MANQKETMWIHASLTEHVLVEAGMPFKTQPTQLWFSAQSGRIPIQMLPFFPCSVHVGYRGQAVSQPQV